MEYTNDAQQVKIENPIWFGVQIAIGMGIVLPIFLVWIGGSLFGIAMGLISPDSVIGAGTVMGLNVLVIIVAGILAGVFRVLHKSTKIFVGFVTMSVVFFVIALLVSMF